MRFIEKKVQIDRDILKDKVILEIGCGVRSVDSIVIEWAWWIGMFVDWITSKSSYD